MLKNFKRIPETISTNPITNVIMKTLCDFEKSKGINCRIEESKNDKILFIFAKGKEDNARIIPTSIKTPDLLSDKK